MKMEYFIACSPEAHPVIRGTGGFRKARWAREGSGKSGGFRVIYFFISPPGRVYMASIYAKSRQAGMTQATANAFAKLAASIKKELGRK